MFTKEWLVDAAERVVSSFGEAVIAAVASGALASGLNLSTGHVLLIAGITAAAATLKAIVAGGVSGISPASLVAPRRPVTTPPPKDAGYGLAEMAFAVFILVLTLVVLLHFLH